MDRLLHVDVVNRTADGAAGVINSALSEAVAPLGLHYAPDPSSQSACTIGGTSPRTVAAPHTLKYGTTSPTCSRSSGAPGRQSGQAGPAGRTQRGLRPTRALRGIRGNARNRDLCHVRLVPNPETVCTLACCVSSLVGACEAVAGIVASGVLPAALELLDDRTIEAVEASVFAAGYPRDARAVLLVELDGPECAVAEEREQVERVCRELQTIELRVARDEAERVALWRGRKGAFGAMGRLAPDLYVHDAVVPRTRLRRWWHRSMRPRQSEAFRLANILHAGDGTCTRTSPSTAARRERCSAFGRWGRRSCAFAWRLVVCSPGEHGIGLEKRDYMRLLFEECDLEPMRWVHDAFDPLDRCNPGKLIPTRALARRATRDTEATHK